MSLLPWTWMLLLFAFVLISCSTALDSQKIVTISRGNGEENHKKTVGDSGVLVSPDSLCLSSCLFSRLITSDYDLEIMSPVRSLSLHYRSEISFPYDDHLGDLRYFPQPGIHLLVEHGDSLFNHTSLHEGIKERIQNTLYLGLQQDSLFLQLVKNGGALMRSKEWIFGNPAPSLASTYFFTELTHKQHQEIQNRFQKERTNLLHSVSSSFDVVTASASTQVTEYYEKDIVDGLESSTYLLAEYKVTGEEILFEKELFLPVQPSSGKINSMSRSVSGEGFHKDLVTVVEFSAAEEATECEILVVERFSEGIFVDQYQVDELFKFGGKTQVILDHTIDLEKPSYQSSPNVIHAYQTIKMSKGFGSGEIVVPFHYRYQMPSATETFISLHIPSPSFFLRCHADEEWTTLYSNNSHQLTILVPTGQTKFSSLVVNATLLFTSVGAILALLAIFCS